MEAFASLLAERKIDLQTLITHRFPIERAHQAYELITGRSREPFLGVVIQYAGAEDSSRTLSLVPETAERVRAVRGAATTPAVGLLGAGAFASSTLIPAMKAAANTALISVCTSTGAHAKDAARKFGFRACTCDDAELIHNADVNTVVVATRHHLHATQVLRALKAGKNVFCEKPLCLSEEELHSIIRVYEGISSERPVLMVGFNRRFAPMVTSMKSFLSAVAEPLALHYRINAGYLAPDHWVNDREQGGGRILGELCHFIDLLMFLAGSPIVEVEARAVGALSRYSGDNVLINLRFANGSEGAISYLACGDRASSKERIEVFGGGRTAVLDDFRRLELVHNGHQETIRSRLRQDKGHRAEWAAFAQSLQQRKESPIRFEEIVCSTLATFRVEDSLATGNRVSVDGAALIAQALQIPSPNSSLHE